jgi:hypothetical protein
MAGLQQRGGSYRVFFRFRGKRQAFALGKVSKQEADAKAAQVDYLLLRLRQRLIELPHGVNIADFLQHDGKPPESAPAALRGNASLVTLWDRFLATHAGGAQGKDPLHDPHPLQACRHDARRGLPAFGPDAREFAAAHQQVAWPRRQSKRKSPHCGPRGIGAEEMNWS